MIDYGHLEKALANLEDQWKHYGTIDPQTHDLTREAIEESIVQRFEICFECARKMIYRFLNHELGIADVPIGAKPLFRQAGQSGLLDTDEWISYSNARNKTSREYGGGIAQDVLDLAPELIAATKLLLQAFDDQALSCPPPA